MRILLIAFLVLATIPSLAFAHAGEDHGTVPGTEGGAVQQGPITLSNEAIHNLDIQSVTAELKPIEEKVSMIARTQVVPEKHAFVSTIFSGQVRNLRVKLGENIIKGQPLISVEPLNIGAQTITLKSPISGRVIRQNVGIGQPVTEDTVLMEIADTSELLVQGALYETPDLAKIRVGQKAEVIVDIFPDLVIPATIQRLDVSLEDDSRTFDVYALIDNTDGSVLPNLQGELRVKVGEDPHDHLVVPKKAILENNGRSFLFVRDGNEFLRREVTLGIQAGHEVEILSGIFPGEDVVTQGNYQLQYVTPDKPKTEDKPVGDSKNEESDHKDDGHAR
ncbi:MAG: efflux RND transporter periplasmic adaptor subunit [Alphaproteobacteria bacterium]|nr:efflux RND transporter periplasmic adaptor subunit [Alphaproteobacteria bacterium]